MSGTRVLHDLAEGDYFARRDAVRHLIRDRLYAAGAPMTEAARVTGHSTQRWHRMMTDGEAACPSLADLVQLERLAPGLLAGLAEACGQRVVPRIEAASSPAEMLSVVGATMAEESQLVEATTRALQDGAITHAELAGIEQEAEHLLAAVGRCVETARASVVTSVRDTAASRR